MTKIANIINIINITNILNRETVLWVALIAVLFLAVLFYWQRIKYKRLSRRAALFKQSAVNFDPVLGLEKTSAALLELISKLIKVEGYYLYILDKKKMQFVLRSVRHKDVTERAIAPSYSGLLAFKKENYLPPLGLPADKQPTKMGIIRDGHVPLYAAPFKSGLAIVRFGPVNGLPAKVTGLLVSLVDILDPMLKACLEIEDLRSREQAHTTSSKAVHNLTNSTMDYEGNLKIIMNLSIKMIGAVGGVLMTREQDRFSVPFVSKAGENPGKNFVTDLNCHRFLHDLLAGEEYYILSRDDKEFYLLPPYFSSAGMEFLILARLTGKSNKGMALFWFDHVPLNIETHRFNGLRMMTRRIADLMDSYQKFNELSESYLDMLKILVETIDNLEPYSVGYSELMARYAEIIARELKLDQQEIEDIVLAACLSNIGLLGLSNELIFKPGKYTELEFETMKLHAEVGAAIIEATVAKRNVAEYIRYHHERIDGNGYPAGLRNKEIPLGARIIAVVQTFLAAIGRREYRDPLPFAAAVQMLNSASGAQLDGDVVQALINWFKKRQANPSRKG